MPSQPTTAAKPAKPFNIILIASLLAGTCDAIAASISYIIKYNKNPVNVFVYVASGVFGKDAFSSDTSIAWWGLLFHYLIAMSFTITFYFIYPYLSKLTKNKVLLAILYGLIVWLIMNFIVVPNSNVPKSTAPFDFAGAIRGLLILMVAIGLPLSFVIGIYYRKRQLQ